MEEIPATVPQPMSFDVEEMLRSKQVLRRRLTTLPIGEKLRLLDELRERAVAIRNARPQELGKVAEQPPDYDSPKDRNNG